MTICCESGQKFQKVNFIDNVFEGLKSFNSSVALALSVLTLSSFRMSSYLSTVFTVEIKNTFDS